jgi:hypothetical protein
MAEFAPPDKMTAWATMAMVELRESICRDLFAEKVFAYHTRLRQPEELYTRILYALFIATDAELPHMMAGSLPNGLSLYYEPVNKLVYEGRGRLLESRPGLAYGTFRPIDTLHDGAHVSFRSFLTCIGWVRNPEYRPSPEEYCKYLEMYCRHLDSIHGHFKAGRSKEQVLVFIKHLHDPASQKPNL